MTSIDLGSEGPRSVTITVNQPWVESLAEGQLRAYVHVLTTAAAASPGRTVDQLCQVISAGMKEAGIRLPQVRMQRLADQLTRSDGTEINVLTSAGRVLHGSEQATPQNHDPLANPGQDPDHPSRPTYS